MERTTRSCRAVTPILAIVFLVALSTLVIPSTAHAAPGAAAPGAPSAWALHLPAWLTSWLQPVRGWLSGSGPVATYGRAGSSIDPNGAPSDTSTTSASAVTLPGPPGSSHTL